MTALTNAAGELITDEQEMLVMIRDFYTNLYQQPLTLDSDKAEREEPLLLIDKKVSRTDNEAMLATPTMEDMEEALESMAAGKSPGEDGITLEVVKAMWETIRTGSLLFIQTVWREHMIGCKNAAGIVKLLPKNDQKTLLQHWRPISLLTFGYKLIGKIISTRLKRLIPKLVDDEQCGFVEGRNIIDNVMCLKLSQDITRVTGEASIFCKLDFMKAFDRVQHQFLWDTMLAMEFPLEFIDLVKCLVANGTAKVHINGLYTDQFQLERGVRQGCPISPLLFAISTQPLMRMLREKERKGELQGVSIPGGKSLLHRLFADDSGVSIAATEENFQSMKGIIEGFERISGASLNMSKSVILPMALERLPPWIHDSGCTILEGNNQVTYLGFKVGVQLQKRDYARDLGDKVTRRLSHWTRRFLTWPAKRVLMGEQGGWKVENSANGLGKYCQTMRGGGATLPDFRNHSRLSKTKVSNQILRRRAGGVARHAQVPTPTRDAAQKGRKRAQMVDCPGGNAATGKNYDPGVPDCYTTAQELESRGRWRRLEDELRGAEIDTRLSPDQQVGVRDFQQWLTCLKLGNIRLEESSSWKWQADSGQWKGWQRNTKHWRKLMQQNNLADDLSDKWPEENQRLPWQDKWKLLWSPGGTNRVKLWIWRILRRAFFTGERANKMQVSNDLCPSCNIEPESVNHLFWSCREAKAMWDRLRHLTVQCNTTFSIKNSLISTVDEALELKREGSTLVYILAAITQLRWKDRNNLRFKGKRTRTPVLAALKLARHEVEASFGGQSKEQRWETGLRALREINTLIKTEENRFQRTQWQEDAEFLTSQIRTIRLDAESSQSHTTTGFTPTPSQLQCR
ncbi:hypothetical protein R1sor_023974 [Riccia sorocarpa]|uniref:Reverse transcriptase domain-containing protein n=1 Tax=Riccia sorocarpa TaxID=122646 RepID=A0ABD3GP60_9MARC